MKHIVRINANSKERPEVIEIGNTLELDEIRHLIDYDSPIDIVVRKIGGTYFDIIIDDEGRLQELAYATGISKDYHEDLVGTLLITHHDREGNTIGLTEEEVKTVLNNCYQVRKHIEYPNELSGGKEVFEKDTYILEYDF